jgi:hypothetical protein
MNFFNKGKLEAERMMERVIARLDIPQIVRDVMGTLVIRNLELYLVVAPKVNEDNYDFVGLAYSKGSALKLKKECGGYKVKIVKVDMGKLVALLERFGATERIVS